VTISPGFVAGVKQWAVSVAILLLINVALGVVILRGQRHTAKEVGEAKQEMAAMTSELAKLRQGIADYPKVEAQVRGARSSEDQTSVQEAVYADLGKQLRGRSQGPAGETAAAGRTVEEHGRRAEL
jgi:hypothetical protein